MNNTQYISLDEFINKCDLDSMLKSTFIGSVIKNNRIVEFKISADQVVYKRTSLRISMARFKRSYILDGYSTIKSFCELKNLSNRYKYKLSGVVGKTITKDKKKLIYYTRKGIENRAAMFYKNEFLEDVCLKISDELKDKTKLTACDFFIKYNTLKRFDQFVNHLKINVYKSKNELYDIGYLKDEYTQFHELNKN